MGSAGSAVPGMDGLAMALWALWNSNTFSAALQKAVNLLGDADTVACRHLPSCSRCGVDTFTAFTGIPVHAFTVQSEPLLHEVNVSHLLLEHGS